MSFTTGATILLPFDGSEASIHAARHVAANARASKVLVLNVQRLMLPDSAFTAAPESIVEWHRKAGEETLRPAQDILACGNVLIELAVAFGPRVESICRVARERACSVIVVGTRARHPLVNLFSGSVSCRVARESPIPVLMVRSNRSPVMRMPRYEERRAPC